MEEQTNTVNAYATLCTQAGETAYQIAVLQQRHAKLLAQIDQLRTKEDQEKRAKQEAERAAEEAGA